MTTPATWSCILLGTTIARTERALRRREGEGRCVLYTVMQPAGAGRVCEREMASGGDNMYPGQIPSSIGAPRALVVGDRDSLEDPGALALRRRPAVSVRKVDIRRTRRPTATQAHTVGPKAAKAVSGLQWIRHRETCPEG